MHLNREYVKQGAVDPQQLFVTEDVTDPAGGICGTGWKKRIEKMFGGDRFG